MALNVLRGGFLLGLLVGAGAALVGPAVWRNGRPLAKEAIRTGLAAYAAGQVAVAKVAEEMSDMVAELQQETAGPDDVGGEASAGVSPNGKAEPGEAGHG